MSGPYIVPTGRITGLRHVPVIPRRDGFDAGERTGYRAGLRAGRITWLAWGALAGAAVTALAVRLGAGVAL